MVKRQLQRISLGSLFFIIGAISIFAQPKTMVSGKVISKEKQEVVDFATVYLKGTTYGCTTNEEGIYHLHAPAGKYRHSCISPWQYNHVIQRLWTL